MKLRTKKALDRVLAVQRCPNRFLIQAIDNMKQSIIDVQTHLGTLFSSLVQSLYASEDFSYIEESPVKQFFQSINAEIGTLWIHDYQFDFIRQETSKNKITHSLFEELRSYQNRSDRVRIHTDNSFLEWEDFMRIPLVVSGKEIIWFFSFPKEKNICLLPFEEMENLVGFIMEQIISLLIFLEQKSLTNAANHNANYDHLTQIPNRRLLLEKANTLINIARRENSYISFFFIDLDYFKKINDTYGHPVGDRILKRVSAALQEALRLEDALGRYGGEEFWVVIKHLTEEEGLVVADRLLHSVRSITEEVWGNEIRPTCSIGMHTSTGAESFIETWFASADKALYQAKANGRNQIVQHSEGEDHASVSWRSEDAYGQAQMA